MFVDDFFDSNSKEDSDDFFDCCFRQNQINPSIPNYFYGGMQPMPVYPCAAANIPMYGPIQPPMMPIQPLAGTSPMPSTNETTSGTATQVPQTTTPDQNFVMAPGSPVSQDVLYTQGYLRTQIGKKVRIEFLIGTCSLNDRVGTLLEVGISYVIIRPIETDDKMLCDIYSIKFVTIYQ